MPFRDKQDYSEDMFADTRMSFGDHLEDLRYHLWRAIWGFLVAMVISFVPGYWVLQFIAAPVEKEIQKFYDERLEKAQEDLKQGNPELVGLNQAKEEEIELDIRALAKELGIKSPETAPEDGWVKFKARIRPLEFSADLTKALQKISRRPGLSTLGPMEAFMAYVKVCFMCGLVLGSPWIFVQIWSFIAAGLYPHEKRLVNVYLPVSLVLFVIGALICQFFVIPNALGALLWFNHWLNLEPDLRFNEWLGFAIMLPVLFGISFQLPILMMFLDRVGIMTPETYIKKWRIAVFAIHAFAAIVTPMDMISMESLALTMCGLYGLGILLCWLNPERRHPELDVPDSEEMVEV